MLKRIPVIIHKVIIIVWIAKKQVAFAKIKEEFTFGTGKPASLGSLNANTSFAS
jgi:hypothetical protein